MPGKLSYFGGCGQLFGYLSYVFAVTGVTLSIYSTVVCDYVQVNGLTRPFDNDLLTNGGRETFLMGIWYGYDGSSDNQVGEEWACRAYPEEQDVDARLRTVRAMAIVSPLLVIVAYLLVAVGAYRRIMSLIYIAIPLVTLGAAAQGCTLLIMESSLCTDNFLNVDKTNETNCTIFTGSGMSIGATACLVIGSILLCVAIPLKHVRAPWEDEDVAEDAVVVSEEDPMEGALETKSDSIVVASNDLGFRA